MGMLDLNSFTFVLLKAKIIKILRYSQDTRNSLLGIKILINTNKLRVGD